MLRGERKIDDCRPGIDRGTGDMPLPGRLASPCIARGRPYEHSACTEASLYACSTSPFSTTSLFRTPETRSGPQQAVSRVKAIRRCHTISATVLDCRTGDCHTAENYTNIPNGTGDDGTVSSPFEEALGIPVSRSPPEQASSVMAPTDSRWGSVTGRPSRIKRPLANGHFISNEDRKRPTTALRLEVTMDAMTHKYSYPPSEQTTGLRSSPSRPRVLSRQPLQPVRRGYERMAAERGRELAARQVRPKSARISCRQAQKFHGERVAMSPQDSCARDPERPVAVAQMNT